MTRKDLRTRRRLAELDCLLENLDESQEEAIFKLIRDVLCEDPDVVVAAAEKKLASEDKRATGWAVVLLISVGLILVIATLVFQFGLLQLILEQLPSKELSTAEFITAISLGTILVAFGGVFLALLRMYQLEARAESVRIHLKNRSQIFQMLAESQTRTTDQRGAGSGGGGAAPRVT